MSSAPELPVFFTQVEKVQDGTGEPDMCDEFGSQQGKFQTSGAMWETLYQLLAGSKRISHTQPGSKQRAFKKKKDVSRTFSKRLASSVSLAVHV